MSACARFAPGGWLALRIAFRRTLLRYLRRGTHPPYSAIQFNRILWLNLAACEPYDTS